MSGSRPHAAVLYNAPSLPADHPHFRSDADVVAVAHEIEAILNRSMFQARTIAAAPPVDRLVAELTDPRPDVVFNLIEGFAGLSAGEAWIYVAPGIARAPRYTGCPSEAQGLCHQKGRTKALLSGFGLPTAPFQVISGDLPPAFDFPGPYFS